MWFVSVKLDRLDNVALVFYVLGETRALVQLERNTGTSKRVDHLFDIFNMSSCVLGNYYDVFEVYKSPLPVVPVQDDFQGISERHRSFCEPEGHSGSPIRAQVVCDRLFVFVGIINWDLP